MNTILFAALLALPAASAGFEPGHSAFDKILRARVRGDGFDYAGLKADPKPLDAYLENLAGISEEAFERWTQAEQEAFVINLYNATMLKIVVDHYPVGSVKDLGFAFGVFRRPTVHAWGKALSLRALEKDYARKRFGDYRVHFALVCASKGCPPLRAEAYTGARLDAQLEDQGRRFFAQREKNRVEPGERTLYVSPILKWYAEDFDAAGGPIGVARRYLTIHERESLKDGFKVKYTDYDWSLNGAVGSR